MRAALSCCAGCSDSGRRGRCKWWWCVGGLSVSLSLSWLPLLLNGQHHTTVSRRQSAAFGAHHVPFICLCDLLAWAGASPFKAVTAAGDEVVEIDEALSLRFGNFRIPALQLHLDSRWTSLCAVLLCTAGHSCIWDGHRPCMRAVGAGAGGRSKVSGARHHG